MTDRLSGREVGRRIVAAVQASIARSQDESARQIEALRAAMPQPLSDERVLKLVRQEMQRNVAAKVELSPAEMLAAVRPYLDAEFARLELSVERRKDSSPSIEDIRAEVARAVAAIEPRRGEDGKSITVDDIMPYLEAAIAKYERESDRITMDRCERVISNALANVRQPQDGRDGASIKDFNLSINDRDLTVTMRIGDEMVSRTIPLPLPYDGGVYKSGQAYQQGAIVTFSGSAFIAQREAAASEKPEASNAWRLLVKRGRDGKDAE